MLFSFIKSRFVALALSCFFFFFNDTATTEIYTLSLHDALPISLPHPAGRSHRCYLQGGGTRSEEHTSELQAPCKLVCRLLLEKKKNRIYTTEAAGAKNRSPSCALCGPRR